MYTVDVWLPVKHPLIRSTTAKSLKAGQTAWAPQTSALKGVNTVNRFWDFNVPTIVHASALKGLNTLNRFWDFNVPLIMLASALKGLNTVNSFWDFNVPTIVQASALKGLNTVNKLVLGFERAVNCIGSPPRVPVMHSHGNKLTVILIIIMKHIFTIIIILKKCIIHTF